MNRMTEDGANSDARDAAPRAAALRTARWGRWWTVRAHWRRYRRAAWTAVVAGLVVLSVLDRRSSASRRPAPADRYRGAAALVVHVVDGDTIDVDIPDGRSPRTRIRLWGVDCPEIAHGAGSAAAHFGPEAAEFSRRSLLNRQVTLELEPVRPHRDRHGRLLAYVRLPGAEETFNETLLRTGHAYADSRFDHEFRAEFAAAEREARRDRRGLWRNVRLEQIPRWRLGRDLHPMGSGGVAAPDRR
jgi:micrococcal nuclease